MLKCPRGCKNAFANIHFTKMERERERERERELILAFSVFPKKSSQFHREREIERERARERYCTSISQ